MTGREPDCDEVLAALFLFLDGECDHEINALIREHLDGCSPCLAQLGVDREVKELIARKCGGDIAPSSLRERLRGKLSEVVVETRVETRIEFRTD